ncbi:claudin-18 [Ciona intestinalis]
MASGLHIAVCILYVIAFILEVVTVFLPYWKRNDLEDTLNDSIVRHEGLWIRCQTFATGNWDCDDFNRFFLGLPTELQAARGFSLSSLFISFIGISLAVAATVLSAKSLQNKLTIASGGVSMLAGLLIIAAVSWYANDIRIQHVYLTRLRLTGGSGTRYTFGYALFIGWVGGALQVVGSIMALCISCGNSDEEDIPPTYRYHPTKSTLAPSQEYV